MPSHTRATDMAEDIFDAFEALGLERDATPHEIRSSYRQLARRYHPNRSSVIDGISTAQSDRFCRVHRAWLLLCKADLQRRYKELLELHELHKSVVAGAAELLDFQSQYALDAYQAHTDNANSHGSSDVDDDDDDDEDLPRVAVPARRAISGRPSSHSSGLENIDEDCDGGRDAGLADQGASLSGGYPGSKSHRRSGSEHADENNAASERRRKLQRLRRRELDSCVAYKKAMEDKFKAESAADKAKEDYELAAWRRDYFERTQKNNTQQKVKLVRMIERATKAFQLHRLSGRRMSMSTFSPTSGGLSSVSESFDKTRFLSPPSRTKSFRRPTYSSDISGDQTSSDEDEYASDATTPPSRSPRSRSPRPGHYRRPSHHRYRSLPSILPIQSSGLSNGAQGDMSPIVSDTAPKVFVRAATNLAEMVADPVSDPDTASASSRSASPAPVPSADDRGRLQLVPVESSSSFLMNHAGHRRRSPSAGRRTPSPYSMDNACHFRVKAIGRVQFQYIRAKHVHKLTYLEKQWLLDVEPDADIDPDNLLESLTRIDENVAAKFSVKPDIRAGFSFRLIYNHGQVPKKQTDTFIALSYRRTVHTEERNGRFELPLAPEIYQAVWDERLSEDEGVWIDQICIDGHSEEEKTISMSAMDMVYRSARLVVVALDDVSLTASQGDTLATHMNEFNEQVHVPANKRFRRKQTPYLESHNDLYLVLRTVLRSSWFKRAWCRHEMRLAREHIFLVPCETARGSKGVLRFTGKCLTHLLGLATEVPFERSIEEVKPALYAFFKDRSALPADEFNLRSHHGNFTTVVAEVMGMEAGGDPKIPEEQRAADARKDKISIILNTMECGLALHASVRDPTISLPISECNYMLLLLALAARDPGALASVGLPLRGLPYGLKSSWLFEPTNVDSGLNNYRTLDRLPERFRISTSSKVNEHSVCLDLKFLNPGKLVHKETAAETLELARHFINVCEQRKWGRNRKRYLLNDRASSMLFGSMRDVYVETLACLFELGPDWMGDVCENHSVSRWRHDLEPARQLLIALKSTSGRWPKEAWSIQGAGFVMDFVNFAIIRGMPRRQITTREEWRPVWVAPPAGGKVMTFVPRGGELRVAVPAALLDREYVHLARMWVLKPRGEFRQDKVPHYCEWSLLGKSVLFCDDDAIERLELDNDLVREGQRVFGRELEDTK